VTKPVLLHQEAVVASLCHGLKEFVARIMNSEAPRSIKGKKYVEYGERYEQ
jgi:hypothetical protein